MFKEKLSKYLLVSGMGAVGLIAGIAGMAGAQGATITTPVSTAVISNTSLDTPELGDVADTPGTIEKTHGHRPLGGDGVVLSITGTTIVVGEESDEGGAPYTVDASKASITNNDTAATLADIKVGAKIFVDGVTTGTNVSATSISLGHKGERGDKAGDPDGTGVKEAAEPTESTETSGQ